jgi:hypothetical protein
MLDTYRKSAAVSCPSNASARFFAADPLRILAPLVIASTLYPDLEQSLGCRPASTRRPAPSTSSASVRLRLHLLCQSFCLSLSFVVHVRINANFVAEIFDASSAHVHLVWALPASSDGGPRAWRSSGVAQHAVVFEKSVCGFCGGRQRFDGRFVVAVGGCLPLLRTGHGS